MDVDEFISNKVVSLSDEELLRFAVFNIVQEMVTKRKGTEVFRDRENFVLVLLSSENVEKLHENAIKLAEEIHRTVTDLLPVKISIGIGHPCKWTENLTYVHQSAVSSLDYRYVIGKNEIIQISDMEQMERPTLLSVIPMQQELVTKLKTGTFQDIEEWMEVLFQTFREHVYPIDACHLRLQQIVLTLMHTLYEWTGSIREVFGDMDNPLTELQRFETLEEIKAWLKVLCHKAISVIHSMREDQVALQIEKAKEYVQQRYSDPELSLKVVTRYVSISPSYFSSVFKRVTGKTFVEYLTDIRMEKAKELLRLTSRRSYEIAYAVGFRDPHYFSSVFKKYTGDTPTDYRAKYDGKV